MVQLRGMHGDCDCKTCTGGETPTREDGEIVFGGWRCCCPCHYKHLLKDENERMDDLFKKIKQIEEVSKHE